MKRALCFLAVLTLVSSAVASVDFFFSSSADPYGLKDPGLAFKHSNGNGYDFRDGYELMPPGGPYAVPPYGEPGVMPNVTLDPNVPGVWAYIWARFNNEPPPSQVGGINGIAINIKGGPNGQDKIAYYQLDNTLQTGILAKKWDGDAPVFYQNPTGLIAITASGQRNTNADTPWQLYVGGAHRAFLLGAVRGVTGGEMTVEITATSYSGVATNPNPPPFETRSLNKVIVVPEPASLMLLALVGLVLRRR